MELIPGLLPPSRETWEWVVFLFQFFPLVTILQWVQPWYSMGKTSTVSRFNIPGRIAWLTMEVPGFLTVSYIMYTLPDMLGIALPWDNYIMAAAYIIHYIYRAVIFPIVAPSISPMHLLVWLGGFAFQVVNGLSIGGWLGGYGNVSRADWSDHKDNFVASARMELGLMIMAISFALNLWHDDELREIRRAALRNQKKRAAAAEESTGKGKDKGVVGVDKVYMIPKNGGFWWILYPHYLAEWFEWAGYCIMGGPKFKPGMIFLVNEITTMLPRAVQGRKWYVERFGEEKVAGRKAIIPGLL